MWMHAPLRASRWRSRGSQRRFLVLEQALDRRHLVVHLVLQREEAPAVELAARVPRQADANHADAACLRQPAQEEPVKLDRSRVSRKEHQEPRIAERA